MKRITFLTPHEGDLLLSGADGHVIKGRLVTQVRVLAPHAGAMTIGGVPARLEDGVWWTLTRASSSSTWTLY